MSGKRCVVAATSAASVLLYGCAKPVDLTGLPWVRDPAGCQVLKLNGSHGAFDETGESSPLAYGVVAFADGRPVDTDLYVRVRFSTLGLDDNGGQSIGGYGPDFEVCLGLDDVRWARNQFWRAEV